MSSTAASSSSPAEADRPVIVRVKRKASQSPLDAFWLEISERPTKRPLIDFEKLSISESSAGVEEFKNRKVFVQHVETITTSEITVDILQPLLLKSGDGLGAETKFDARRTFKTENKRDQLLSKAIKQKEILAKNARFEQIWRSRKEKSESDRNGDLNEMFRLYDIVRVDGEQSSEFDVERRSEMEECKMMAEFLPLLREHLPTAAAEVESDIRNTFTKRAIPDKYVYDYYAVRDATDIVEEKVPSLFPLVQVEDEDFYDGPDDSDEYATDDSNAEDNPLNDYPDEDPSDMEDEEASESSGGKSEEGENNSQKSSEHEVLDLDGSYPLSEDDGIYHDSGRDATYDDDEVDYVWQP